MFKAKASKEVKVGERAYWFICEGDSPVEEVLDVLKILSRDVQTILENAKNKPKDPEVVVPEVEVEEFAPV